MTAPTSQRLTPDQLTDSAGSACLHELSSSRQAEVRRGVVQQAPQSQALAFWAVAA